MLRLLTVSVLCVLASACAFQSPPRTDPLADLVGGAKLTDAPVRTIADAKSKSLALIVSTSTETQIKHREEADRKYLEGYIKTYQSRSYDTVKSMFESVGPRKLIDVVVGELRQRFKSISVVSDLTEFRAGAYDVASVVDIGMEYKTNQNPMKVSAEFTTDIALHLFDPQIRRIGIASGKATEYGDKDTSGEIAKGFLLFAPKTPPEDFHRPLVEAERKSRISAFKRLGTSLDQIVLR